MPIPVKNLLTIKAAKTLSGLSEPEAELELNRITHAYFNDDELPTEIDAAVYAIVVKKSRDKKLYARYLKSAHWQQFRAHKLKLVENKCEDCGAYRRSPQLHHLTYLRLGDERLSDVLALCGRCHMKRHKKKIRRRKRSK